MGLPIANPAIDLFTDTAITALLEQNPGLTFEALLSVNLLESGIIYAVSKDAKKFYAKFE